MSRRTHDSTEVHEKWHAALRYSSEAALGLLADALEEAAGLQQLHWQVLNALSLTVGGCALVLLSSHVHI